MITMGKFIPQKQVNVKLPVSLEKHGLCQAGLLWAPVLCQQSLYKSCAASDVSPKDCRALRDVLHVAAESSVHLHI